MATTMCGRSSRFSGRAVRRIARNTNDIIALDVTQLMRANQFTAPAAIVSADQLPPCDPVANGRSTKRATS